MIYFIRPRGFTGPVKIGVTRSIESRLASLQTGNHLPLYVWRTFEGNARVEEIVHWRFAAQRIRGEWFDYHPDMDTYEPNLEDITAKMAPYTPVEERLPLHERIEIMCTEFGCSPGNALAAIMLCEKISKGEQA